VTETITVHVNGTSRQVAAGTTVAAVVAELTSAGSGVAVAVNGEVLPRPSWARTPLAAADRLEVLTAVQGG
jgi:sulfur carrier protein